MHFKSDESQSGFGHLLMLLGIIIVVGAVGFAGWRVFNKVKDRPGGGKSISSILSSKGSAESKAVAAGKSLSNNYCQGTGDATFTHLPMNAGDFAILIPYGLTVGGHVTPIDHQYFQPTNFQSARDTYPVYAMADAVVTDIQSRYTPNHGTDYRLVFAHSCTFLYYYDLVTSLTPALKADFDKKQFNIPVKAGDQIGAIGGQTLDFAVWNTTKVLTGFANPASYSGEAWKIYTADPIPYYTPQLRQIVEAKDPRVAQPIAGKIDYDINGRLIGNWFQKGTGGYSGKTEPPDQNYYKTHLSFAPDLYDPSYFRISIGSLYTLQNQSNMQQVTLANSPLPQNVSTATGLVKYDLVGWKYINPDGTEWNQMTAAKNVTLQPQTNSIFGCALAQMTAAQELKFEVFVGQQCSGVSGFDPNAIIYTR